MFEAKYGGTCGRCEERIRPGQRVTYVDDVLVHAGCVASAPVVRLSRLDLGPTEKVCTSCFMVRPCECDDERRTA